MRKNIYFTTTKGNHYLYIEGLQCSIFLPPGLIQVMNGEDDNIANEQEKEYYQKKYLFLKENGLDKKTNISFITKPDPEIVKIKLANIRQILIEVTDGCNLKCKYCGYGEMYENYDKRLSPKMPFEKVETLFEYLIDLWHSNYNFSFNNNVDVSFYGGEPLLNMDLIKTTIDYLSKKKISNMNFSYRMTTNALLLDRYMDFLVDKNFNLLISLDGDEYSNSYRVDKNGKNSFFKVYNNILLLKDKYPEYYAKHVNFNAVLHDRNTYEGIYLFIKHSLNKNPLISELNDNGIKEEKVEMFRRMYKNTYEHQKEAYETNSEIHEDSSFSRAENVAIRSILHAHTGNSYKSINHLLKEKQQIVHMPSGTCMAFYKKIFLTVNGKIFPCEKIGQNYPLGYVLFNKVCIDFEQISNLYKQMYEPILKLCEQCYHQVNCGQCVFNIAQKKKKKGLYCPSFVNKKVMADYMSENISYLEENRTIYEKIINHNIEVR